MKFRIIFVALIGLLAACKEESAPTYASFDDYPAAENASLWLNYSPESTTFSLWSPTADAVKVNLYEQGNGGESTAVVELSRGENGLWSGKVEADLKGQYYTFQVKIDDHWLDETPGIYAQAIGVNGQRAMVLNLDETNPADWSADRGPAINKPNEAIIYELHVRDITIDPSSGSSYPGKYLGLVETGTKSPEGEATGIDHMKELGITHVHLLPSFDNYSIKEDKLDSPQFNWGYDPQNYNVPEGSFSTNPYDAAVRIKEFKEMVKGFHDQGIGVILDVVYNHTGRTEGSNFNLESPGYYYRHWDDNKWADASACGNETASERPMMRKFMIESIRYWIEEYHLDGFRFDLMGIHDIETMNEIATAAKAINPNVFIYGEGWTAGDSPLPEEKRALKKHITAMPQISAFSDDIRGGIKGSVFDEKSTGFVSGADNTEESIKFGVVGSIQDDQIDYKAVNYSDAPWANEPWQAISYVSCHDNQTLYDKLKVSQPEATEEELIAMDELANGIVLTSQGISFIHAGAEMLRTKGGEHNSYNQPDAVNSIKWSWKTKNKGVFNFYKKLIALRKHHPAFYMPTAEMVRTHLHFLPTAPGFVGYQINGNANGDSWKDIMVLYNANTSNKVIHLDGQWTIAVKGNQINESGIETIEGKVSVPARSMVLAFRE